MDTDSIQLNIYQCCLLTFISIYFEKEIIKQKRKIIFMHLTITELLKVKILYRKILLRKRENKTTKENNPYVPPFPSSSFSPFSNSPFPDFPLYFPENSFRSPPLSPSPFPANSKFNLLVENVIYEARQRTEVMPYHW